MATKAPRAAMLEKAPTALHEDFKTWLEKETGAKDLDIKAIQLATVLRGDFQKSDYNQKRLEERRKAIETEAAAREQRAKDRAAKTAEKEKAKADRAANPTAKKAAAKKTAPAAKKAAPAKKAAAGGPRRRAAKKAAPTEKF